MRRLLKGIQWTKGRAALVLGAMAYAGVFVFMLLTRPGTKEWYHGFFNMYQAIPPIFGGVLGLSHAFRTKHPRESVRFGWVLIGVGCLSFALGQCLWTYYETFKGQEVPFPGPPDIGYVGTYPCLIAGALLLFTDVQAVAGRARILMDGAIAAASAGILSWYFLVEKLWASADTSLLGKIISVAYPLGDVACLFVALVALLNAGACRSHRRVFGFLATGLLLLTLADTVFTWKNLHEGYETGSWNDWGWSFGWIFIGFAPLVNKWIPNADAGTTRAPREALRALGTAARTFAPYVAAVGSLAIMLIHDYGTDHQIDPHTYIEALFILCLILVRQVFMLMENVALARRVAEMNDGLESMVADRTRKLAGLQELAKGVNSTLMAEEVAAAALAGAERILAADAVALWLDRTGEGRAIDTAGLMGETIAVFPDVVRSLHGRNLVHAVEQFQTFGAEAHVCLLAPLRWQNETVGLIAAVRASGGFDADDAEMLEGVGLEIGAALKNSWRHEDALAAADRDSVTGLLNHRAIHQRIARELARAEEDDGTLSVVMMDMNNFKLFNDTYGHVVGDQVLKTVAEKLAQVGGKRGMPARYGGDEFALLLPGLGSEEAERIALEIKASLDGAEYAKAGDDRRIPIGLSFGIATYPQDGKSRLELLTVADRNLYHAKGSDTGIGKTTAGQRQNRELRAQGSFETLDILVDSIDNKDRYTRQHSEDVTEYALWIAEDLGMSEDTMRTIRMAGLLHDVGKIGVPDEVLRKPGRLTAEEYEIMKRHPRLGELIVGALPGMEGVVDGVRSHHERWDGGGYPDGLAGDDIPMLGRILAVGDAFSAMTTDRPYRKGMDWDAALEQIRTGIGTQFDPYIAQVFLRAVSKRRRPTLVRAA